MTELEQCKATLREDAARLCAKSKHTGHPFGDCPCTVLRVIEGLETELAEVRRAEMRYVAAVDDLLTDTRRLETELAEARIAQAALAVDLSEWVHRQGRHAADCYVWQAYLPHWQCNKIHISPNEIPALLWTIAESESE